MTSALQPDSGAEQNPALASLYGQVRRRSVALCAPLAVEDMVVQSMPDTSPSKWHLAHVSWFFERFILSQYVDDYPSFNPKFDFLFNSYYFTVGQMHQRPRRGLLSRPTVSEVLEYRRHVDGHMQALLETHPGDPDLAFLVTLGLNHEQQHQELMLTDIKHVLAQNPLKPAYRGDLGEFSGAGIKLDFVSFPGGEQQIGAREEGFVFDNETPRHRVLLADFQLANRLVTNGEYLAFISDGGYSKPELWLSDGWSTVQSQQWRRPMYWSESLDSEFSLGGEVALNPDTPVSHLSFYEADAFARWAGARLPSEAEWEVAAGTSPVAGNLVEHDHLHPLPAGALQHPGQGPLHQLFGDAWEWTASSYSSYPGFKPLEGSLGEYNGKFMCNQMVLRGGSCVSPAAHVRASYRNFFYPDARWQFTGLRLARDA